VLHHVPDTAAGIRRAVAALKPGAPLLLYLYYALDNRPAWYRALWRVSDLIRRGVSRPSPSVWPSRRCSPCALAARADGSGARAIKAVVDGLPLAYYRHGSMYTMRTDALDRFGTSLEQRFTRVEIERMMRAAGLERITFREEMPFWCAVGYRAGASSP
jgi:hypothetical protein